jgi:hypothetical protein
VLVQHTLNPGEKTELKVTYETTGLPGHFDKSVTFTTNIPGEEKIEIFTMKGDVREAPAAKIAVEPRRVVIESADRDAGKKQPFTITNEGTLPLVITKIHLKDGATVYFDGAVEGNLVVEPGQSKIVDLKLDPDPGTAQAQKLVLVECNAKNAGSTGYFLIVRYNAR